jgi:hypothetical protein
VCILAPAQQDGYKAEDVVESFDNVTILFAYITGFKVRQVLLCTVLLLESLRDAHALLVAVHSASQV